MPWPEPPLIWLSPWHCSAVDIDVADCIFDIIMEKLSQSVKSIHPAKPWGIKDFFSGVGDYTHNLES